MEAAAAGSDVGGDAVAPPTRTKSGERPPLEKKVPVAEPVPDNPGMVKSPFSGKLIDVKGIPAGSLVADPTFPAEERKHFRVPEMPEGDPVSAGPPPPTDEQIANAPTAREVPGRAGFVFSPYDNRIIDTTGIESGTVIPDPGAPPEELRFLKVP